MPCEACLLQGLYHPFHVRQLHHICVSKNACLQISHRRSQLTDLARVCFIRKLDLHTTQYILLHVCLIFKSRSRLQPLAQSWPLPFLPYVLAGLQTHAWRLDSCFRHAGFAAVSAQHPVMSHGTRRCIAANPCAPSAVSKVV